MDFSEEDRAIVTTIETSPTWSNVPTEVSGIERCPKAIEDRVVERAIQFAPLCRHQRAPDPEVHCLSKLELPDRIEFIVNAKTAKALGVDLPRAVLLRADRVIE